MTDPFLVLDVEILGLRRDDVHTLDIPRHICQPQHLLNCLARLKAPKV